MISWIRPRFLPLLRGHRIVGDGRLYLLDFDLYCLGDPALDAGNFIAHVTEQSLRELGDATALAPVEEAKEKPVVDAEYSEYLVKDEEASESEEEGASGEAAQKAQTE